MVQQLLERTRTFRPQNSDAPGTTSVDSTPVTIRIKFYMGSFIHWYDSDTSQTGDPTAFTLNGTWNVKNNGDAPNGIGVRRDYLPGTPTTLDAWTQPSVENYTVERFYLSSNGIVQSGERVSNANWTVYRADLVVQEGRAARKEELELTGEYSTITNEFELAQGQRPQGGV